MNGSDRAKRSVSLTQRRQIIEPIRTNCYCQLLSCFVIQNKAIRNVHDSPVVPCEIHWYPGGLNFLYLEVTIPRQTRASHG